MELGQNHSRDGLLGPNSIIVVYMDPLGLAYSISTLLYPIPKDFKSFSCTVPYSIYNLIWPKACSYYWHYVCSYCYYHYDVLNTNHAIRDGVMVRWRVLQSFRGEGF